MKNEWVKRNKWNDRRARLRRKFDERWEQMTPEEREKLRHSWRVRCGPFEAPASETSEPA